MLTTEQATTEFKKLRNDIDNQPPHTQAAILRLQTALEKMREEDQADDQLRKAGALLEAARALEATAKSALDQTLVELQQRTDSTTDEIELAEIHVCVVRANAKYKKAVVALQEANNVFDAADIVYQAAVKDAETHPILEPGRG